MKERLSGFQVWPVQKIVPRRVLKRMRKIKRIFYEKDK